MVCSRWSSEVLIVEGGEGRHSKLEFNGQGWNLNASQSLLIN